MNESMPQLPEYEPHPALWARIEADLLADEQLDRMVSDLPTHEPKAMLWEAIEQDLNIQESATIRSRWNLVHSQQFWTRTAAAAVIMLVGVWLFLRPEATEAVRIEYSIEQTNTQPDKASTGLANESSADERAEQFIARQCAEQQQACQRPEVHELRNQLTDLIAEEKRIEREQAVFGDDPALIRAQVKIENQRAEITKELITLLRS
ncbi:hypothetical protein EXU85_34175 [Spirosoma sp. KCTC 42546]|uniref:hypothetical protein n=1 Tax=Spirosoma sp. KCTC 42546 TaxID=2520506 RepID=UPI001159D686|nr:hypothetical protein [Spirosoma sp. KCTC 42546]QDK83383.1 hypothetical protein EXU85_34175 [Spirosoma sp. KCTC 42546]